MGRLRFVIIILSLVVEMSLGQTIVLGDFSQASLSAENAVGEGSSGLAEIEKAVFSATYTQLYCIPELWQIKLNTALKPNYGAIPLGLKIKGPSEFIGINAYIGYALKVSKHISIGANILSDMIIVKNRNNIIGFGTKLSANFKINTKLYCGLSTSVPNLLKISDKQNEMMRNIRIETALSYFYSAKASIHLSVAKEWNSKLEVKGASLLQLNDKFTLIAAYSNAKNEIALGLNIYLNNIVVAFYSAYQLNLGFTPQCYIVF